MTTQYYTVEYTGRAGGSFAAQGALVTWDAAASSGYIVTSIEDGTSGKLHIALVTGTPPDDTDVLTQGAVTATTAEPITGAATLLLYPAFFREDVAVAANGNITWTGPALGVTHSFDYDAQTVNCAVGDIITFSGGQTAEIIAQTDAGATGNIGMRFISPVDQGLPQDGNTFTASPSGGNGTIDGVVHPRTYTPLELHRLLSDLNDDETISGDDDLSVIDPTASDKSTDEIITLLGTININDTVAQHMFGGSITQATGDVRYSGVNIKVTSPFAASRPVLIQNDAIVTDYWNNAYNRDSIAGNVRILRKTRQDGVDIDGRRVKGKLLEYGEIFFEGETTLGTGTTELGLFSTGDGNNNTAEGTVAGAPYNTTVLTEGFQTLNYNNGNGATPFALQLDYGTATAPQAYERMKYIQRRGTAELLFGRNAQLVTGVNRNFAYDAEAGGPFQEDEILAWGTEITFSGQTVNLTLGEVVNFVGSGAKGRIIYQDDNVATGTLIFDMEPGIVPLATDTLSGVESGGNGNVDTVVSNANAGTGLLIALDDDGVTGNLYYQSLTGLDPADNQTVFGSTSNATADVAGTVATRTINNQFIGVYTGSAFQTNFGIGVQPADAIVADQLTNLLGVVQSPPNNQTGRVGGLQAGDYVNVFAWDGVAVDVNGDPEPDFNEQQLAVALVAGVSTVVDVGTGNIPINTPQVGNLRVARDSDGNFDKIPYSSHNGDGQYTLVGTAPSAAAIGNNTYRSPIDLVTLTTEETYTAVYSGTPNNWGITVRRGSNNPIKTFKSNASFGASGFNVNAQRIGD